MNNRITPVHRVANPPKERPLMVFDGDCGFCRFWIERWREATGGSVNYEPFQETADRFPEIPREAFENAVQLIETDGRVTGGADAVFRLLEYSRGGSRFFRILTAIPGFTGTARIAYRFVADHRTTFSFLTRVFFGRLTRRPAYLVARWVFVRLVGIAYLIAFVSLLMQIRGLAGKRGILPASEYLQAIREQFGPGIYQRVPTLCWFGSSDHVLLAMCWAGVILSIATVFGVFPSFCFFLLWALYLSLSGACGVFLGYQWDILLLQAGFLSVFLAPPAFRPDWTREGAGSRMARWLLLGLLFCLMVESGVVKLSSGDDSWWNLTALTYHYETQPLPVWTSWYANQSPLWFETLSVIVMFAIELAGPFAILGPRHIRRAGCAAMIFLQLCIVVTGNYCFFNLLTIALCLLLLDDDAWPRWLRERIIRENSRRSLQWSPWLVAPVAGIDLFMSTIQLIDVFRTGFSLPAPADAVYRAIVPFRTFNGYGLFASMTKSRPEIIVEGSNDGEKWLPYEFKWKPGDLNRRPGLVAPFQPRLDWQMWFAALGDYRGNTWFLAFLTRLLEGSPDVLPLLKTNPFPAIPPRFVRAQLYDYKFTRLDDHTHAWWKREYLGPYCPVLSLSTDQRIQKQ